MKSHPFTLILSIMLVPCVALAQAKVLTLDQARQIGLERNIDVVQAYNNIEGAQSDVLAEKGRWLPSLSLNGGWSQTKIDTRATTTTTVQGIRVEVPPDQSTTKNFRAGLSADYVVFDGLNRTARINQATSNAVSTEYTSNRTRQTIAFEIERTFLDVLRNARLVRVSEENLKRDRRQLERITESNRVGASPIADVYRQQSQVASDELALITAQNNHEKSKVDVLSLIGLDAFDQYEFSTEGIAEVMKPEEIAATAAKYSNIAELQERALKSRPDYLSAQHRVEAADEGISSARSTYFPAVYASAGYSMYNDKLSELDQNRNFNLGLDIRWTIFDNFRTNQAIQNASVQYRNAEVTLQQGAREINSEVKKALLDLEAARKQYEVAQKALVSATEDRKIAEERYNLGAGTLLDLLVGSASQVNAEANTVNAIYNYIVAVRNVEYALGERTY